ncbi:MAG: MBL fold metallo-hydrolase [Pseudonocardia sp.]
MSHHPLIQHVVTSGHFLLDGEAYPVDNNMWFVGDEQEVLVIDASHEADKIVEVVGGRRVVAIACTHAHSDHIDQAAVLADRFDAPVLLNEAEMVWWELMYTDRKPDRGLDEGDVLTVAGVELHALLTPGHSPGGISLHAPALGTVFGGDTLFEGGPGNTSLPHSDFATIISSIRTKLLRLPDDTLVCPGHGATTTIGAEAARMDEYVARGY